MVFSEEVPANFKPSCPCKRRGCPLQRYIQEVHINQPTKRFFTYQCSDPKTWAGCNKTIAPNEVDPTKPKPPEPAKPVEEGFKCPVCGFVAKTEFALNKHLDIAHNSEPPKENTPA